MRKHRVLTLAAAALLAGAMASATLSIADAGASGKVPAAASGKVIGMTSGGGNKGYGCVVTAKPGVPVTGKPVKQTVTFSCTETNIQCSGLSSAKECPTSATINGAFTTPPMSCVVRKIGATAKERFTATVRQASGTAKPSGTVAVTFKGDTLYSTGTGSVKDFDGTTKESDSTSFAFPTGACSVGPGTAPVVSSLSAFSVVTFTS
jgi:hypothetical protein